MLRLNIASKKMFDHAHVEYIQLKETVEVNVKILKGGIE